jgi:DNA-binding beta-propeller fold protein YncE
VLSTPARLRRHRAALVALAALCAAVLAAPAGASAFGPLSSFGSFGQGAGQLRVPGNLEVAPDGTVYVADYSNNRIDVFSATGAFLRAFGKEVNLDGSDVCTTACRAGSENEELKKSAGAMYNPEDVALGPEGNLFVVDVRNNRIDVFTTAGAFVRAFGADVEAGPGTGGVCTTATGCELGAPTPAAGGMSGPTGVAVDPDGNVYVADYGNNRVDVFSTAGAFLYAFGKNVGGPGQESPELCTTECLAGEGSGAAGDMLNPWNLTIGPDGTLYVTEYSNSRVDAFTVEGEFLYAFGKHVEPLGADICTAESGCEEGTISDAAGGLGGPTAVSTDPAGTVYVASEENNRVDVFSAGGAFLRAFGFGVIDGKAQFQTCTASSGCRAGSEGSAPGSISSPYGVAAAAGRIYVTEEGKKLARVEVFGESAPVVTPIAAPAAVKPTPVFKLGKLQLNRRTGRASLAVTVSGPGSLALDGRGLKSTRRQAAAATTVKLPVKLIGKAAKKLAASGTAKVLAKITFTPTAGTALSKTKKLTLKKTLPRRRGR